MWPFTPVWGNPKYSRVQMHPKAVESIEKIKSEDRLLKAAIQCQNAGLRILALNRITSPLLLEKYILGLSEPGNSNGHSLREELPLLEIAYKKLNVKNQACTQKLNKYYKCFLINADRLGGTSSKPVISEEEKWQLIQRITDQQLLEEYYFTLSDYTKKLQIYKMITDSVIKQKIGSAISDEIELNLQMVLNPGSSERKAVDALFKLKNIGITEEMKKRLSILISSPCPIVTEYKIGFYYTDRFLELVKSYDIESYDWYSYCTTGTVASMKNAMLAYYADKRYDRQGRSYEDLLERLYNNGYMASEIAAMEGLILFDRAGFSVGSGDDTMYFPSESHKFMFKE